MELSENSINLINILCSDVEKLNKFVSLFKEEKAYEYCASIIPEYTKEEFEEMKNVLNSKKEIISDDIAEKIGGGSLDDFLYVLDGWKEGEDKVAPVTDSIGIVSRVLDAFRGFKN